MPRGLPFFATPARTEAAVAEERQVFLDRITKRYGPTTAVDDVTLDVRHGEFLAILGPSGSGKTTMMRVIGGFVRPDHGRVEIGGRDVTDLPPNRRDVNTVFQSYALFPHMSVEQNVGYGLRMRRVPRRERQRRVRETLELVQLEEASGKRPAELSGGMQQRVALARALVNRPRVLLLDEPLGALDRALREEMQVELRQLQTELALTFVYVTHDQDEALGMSDRLVVMRSGRLEQVGAPIAVYDDPASLWIAGFVGSSNRIVGTVRSIGAEVELESDAVQIVGARPHGALAVGSAATAVIRPENVDVFKAQPPEPVNHVRVRVREVLSLGAHVKCLASTPGELDLLARWQRREHEPMAVLPGDEVWLGWPAEAVHIYGNEARGVMKGGSIGEKPAEALA
jgi:spermidine/putrescine transport system ATP-binding protein